MKTILIERAHIGRVLVVKGDFEWFVPASPEPTTRRMVRKHNVEERLHELLKDESVWPITAADLAHIAGCASSTAKRVLDAHVANGDLNSLGTRPVVYRLRGEA